MIVWAKFDEVKEGDILIADGGFTCLSEGCRCEVKNDAEIAARNDWPGSGLYVDCADGRHFLDGQLDDGDAYIGLTKA